MTVYLIIAILCIVGIIICLWLLKRNNKVYSFRCEITHLCHKYNIRMIDERTYDSSNTAYDRFLEKYTYEDMLFSFKKLTLENWFTEEEIKELVE